MKSRKGSYIFGILLILTVCVITGCAALPSANHTNIDEQYEKQFSLSKESDAAKLPEIIGEPENPSEERLPGIDVNGETEYPSEERPTEPEISGKAEYPTREEIEALGIPEDMLAYWLVLNGKQPFVSADEGYQEFYWDEYYWRLGMIVGRRRADEFMIVDMDGDGANEIVLYCSPESAQVLHYEDGVVYSYQFAFLGMKRIYENGIYESSEGAASTFYYRLTELNKAGYTEEEIAGMDGDYYEVEGAEATYEEFCDYIDHIEKVELAECIDFTESMLDYHLLGSLSEQEIALVKMLPAEKTIENEADYQEHKQALQLYAAVLTGKEEVIYVTEDAFPEADEPAGLYFSMVDMDGDGGLELVFTCENAAVRILHYEEGKVYGYQFSPYRFRLEISIITTDGVFQTGDNLSPSGYARIVAFEGDGCRIEPVENYEEGSHDRIRYYFFSEETIARWLE